MLIRYTENPEPGLSELTLLCNTGEGELFSNVRAAMELGLPQVGMQDATATPALMCGSGPSLADTLENIREKQARGACVFAMNNAAKYLVEHGITPDYQVLVDPRPQNVVFLEQAWAKECLIASQCAPEMFARCKELGYPMLLWHPALEGINKVIGKAMTISAHWSVGLTALNLAWAMGYRNLHLFGYDSSHREEKGHAFEQPMNAADELVRVCIDSRAFTCSMAMAGQITSFKDVHDMLLEHGAKFEVHGDGALPHLYRSWQREESLRVMTAVYDLGMSPPSYDFLSFLIEAERHRRKHNFDKIDVVFQPGPMYGFRDDNLPPDIPTRQRMLWKVCVSMAKLLPSVRNIQILQTRRNIDSEHVFPEGYEEGRPKAHYGTCYLKGGEPMLRASDDARRKVPRYRYATITVRDAPHWPDRNSNISEWNEVANWLWRQGIQPIWIPDVDGAIPETWMVAREAAADLDLRAALYEGAVINLGVLNGPMSLCAYLKCRYLIAKVVVETAIASSSRFLEAHGFKDGDGFGGNGRLIWKEDKAENIIPHMLDLQQGKP